MTRSMSSAEAKSALLGAFPPDLPSAWGDSPHAHIEAIGQVVSEQAIELAYDMVDRDASLLTCGSARLAAWEAALNLQSTRTARFGTVEARRRAVMARIREYGPPTADMIRSVLAPLLDYADPAQLVLLECSRTALRAAHTYAGSKIIGPFGGATHAVWDFWVNDDGTAAPGCVQADVWLTVADLSLIAVDLTDPYGTTYRVSYGKLGRGGKTNQPVRVYFRSVTTPRITGRWRLQVLQDSITPAELHQAELFCEGFGRSGLASAQFEWAAVFEVTKSSGAADLDAARLAARRVSLATRIGGLVVPADAAVGLPSSDWAGIPADNTIPSGFVPG